MLGRDSRWPIRICANLTSLSYGDFAGSLFFVNCVADHFDHKRVSLVFRDNRDFKRWLVRLIPIDMTVTVLDGSPLPSMELINASDAMIDESMRPWFMQRHNEVDLFITDTMAVGNMTWTFEHLAHLRFPESDVPACTEALVKLGLDPKRWFCTLHCREPGYYGKPMERNLRDCDPATFFPAAAHIIDKLGGQVVRIGHPEMTPFPARNGLIDLSRESGNAYLQTFAISRSRFHLGGPSGPSAIANGFGVPHAMANATDYNPDNERLVYRTIDVITPDGTRLSQKAMFDAGFCKRVLLNLAREQRPFRVEKNSAEEIIRLANFVYEMTSDAPGWREPHTSQRPGPRPNQLIWPAQPRPRGHFLPL